MARPKITKEYRTAVSAGAMGISPEEYAAHREAGESRCPNCLVWHVRHSAVDKSYRAWRVCQGCAERRFTSMRKGGSAYETASALKRETHQRKAEEGEIDYGKVPFEPCPHRPGSEERQRTLAFRYSRGLPMSHPDDNKFHGRTELQLVGQTRAREDWESDTDPDEDHEQV